MYPPVTPHVRRAIRRRYELVPYIYSMAIQASFQGVPPPMRWTGYGFEDDPNVWDAEKGLLQGTREDMDEARLYLPLGPETANGFLDTNYRNPSRPGLSSDAEVKALEAGQWVTVPAPLAEDIAVLARVGSAVPIAKAGTEAIDDDAWRGVEIYPPPGAIMPTQKSVWYEDDGISAYGGGPTCTVTLEYSADREAITVQIVVSTPGGWKPKWLERGVVAVVLPARETRPVRDGREKGAIREGNCRVFEVTFSASN
jgi:hypothetical protein